MKRFWVRIYVPATVNRSHMKKFPEGMVGWVSGHTGAEFDTQIWCMLIAAPTKAAAKEKLLSCYGKSASKIKIDSFAEKENDWLPGDRFPLKPEHLRAIEAFA